MRLASNASLSFKLIEKELSGLLFFFYPIALITFLNQLFLFIEKILLAQLSLELMETSVVVGYLAQVFQSSLVIMGVMAQVHVAKSAAAGEWQKIGPGLWQWIWLALLSMVVSVPGNLIYGYFYLRNTEVEALAWPYLYLLTAINFLYPLGAVLSCFFLGLKKRKLVFWATVGCHLLKLLLIYLLMFGWSDLIPAFGLMGGALAALIAQGILCLLLLAVLLNSKHAESYHTRCWRLNPQLFYPTTRSGLLRMLNRVFTFTGWLATTYFMTEKGGDYLLVLSLGGAILGFSSFIAEALGQAQVLVISNILGTKEFFRLRPAFYAGCLIALVAALLLAVPLLFSPGLTFQWLFPELVLPPSQISLIFWGVWVSILFFSLTTIPVGYILAYQDMRFSVAMGLLSWINGTLWMYWLLDIMELEASFFWFMLGFTHLINGASYLWRTNILLYRQQHAAELST